MCRCTHKADGIGIAEAVSSISFSDSAPNHLTGGSRRPTRIAHGMSWACRGEPQDVNAGFVQFTSSCLFSKLILHACGRQQVISGRDVLYLEEGSELGLRLATCLWHAAHTVDALAHLAQPPCPDCHTF
jgi:hypothetical protein